MGSQHPPAIAGINDGEGKGRRVWFANAEADARNTGLLEGAVCAGEAGAERVVRALSRARRPANTGRSARTLNEAKKDLDVSIAR